MSSSNFSLVDVTSAAAELCDRGVSVAFAVLVPRDKLSFGEDGICLSCAMAVTAPASAILSGGVVDEGLRSATAVDFRFHVEIRSSLMVL